MWPFRSLSQRAPSLPPASESLPAGEAPFSQAGPPPAHACPPPGHPERLIPHVPASASEAVLWRQLRMSDQRPMWLRFLADLRWMAGMGTMVIVPEMPDDDE